MTIQEFDKEKYKQIPELVEELKARKWKPYPYLEISIPKSKEPSERRRYQNMCKRLAKCVVKREDWVNIYPLCTECFARIRYIPEIKKKEPVKIAVI